MARTRCIRALGIAAVLALGPALQALAVNVTDPGYPRALEQEGPVSVSWTDPAGFSDIRLSRNRFEARRGDWVREIAAHVARRAGRALGPGETLEVRITDIRRAGEYEPTAGSIDRVRIIRDIYPPRIDLHYARHDANGRIVDSGDRRLFDVGFLTRPGYSPRANDSLRFEKRLVDDWVRRDLRGDVAGGG
jgi:hypothetical protein